EGRPRRGPGGVPPEDRAGGVREPPARRGGHPIMKDQDLSALVVRAPDNIVYLANYWCMKGYDAVVFPREGNPTLIAIEPQLADAQRNSWTTDIRLFKSYDERDPRPPQYRALDIALRVLKDRGLADKVGIELNMGTQSADRMVG